MYFSWGKESCWILLSVVKLGILAIILHRKSYTCLWEVCVKKPKQNTIASISLLDFYTCNLFLSGASTPLHWAYQTFLLQQRLVQAKHFQWWKCSVTSCICGWTQQLSSIDYSWECVTCMERFLFQSDCIGGKKVLRLVDGVISRKLIASLPLLRHYCHKGSHLWSFITLYEAIVWSKYA